MRAYPFFSAAVFAAIISIFSCSSGDDGPDENEYGGGNSSNSGEGGCTGSYGSVTDKAGRTYRTTKIGTQTWMAENLNYNPGTGNSACYYNQTGYCNIYGRLYDWETALTACPSGWHLPSHDEWETLVNYVEANIASDDGCYVNCAGIKLRATSGWSYDVKGTDNCGFSALPGGIGEFDGIDIGAFNNGNIDGYWWSASGYGIYNDAYYSLISSSYTGAYLNYGGKHLLYSVRCVKD